ncbi:uncharacterized protein LOC8263229 isoform X4 [Ricinus communis]|uniref:uncharacterized protein LOC8263229 isoform X4 n=1 Tax=Ricinus communis TaxID=3988 RepID=UPI00201B2B0A|nr:uncharacterized protein LOC8263229 isoform X4 [Ricinus communis]
MEVKLRQKIHFSFPHCETSFKKHFQGLAESWRFHLLKISKLKGHFGKGGEKLNSISRHYGESFHPIVDSNKNISDVDFLCKGQLPNIPAFVPADCQLIKISGKSSFYQKERPRSSMAILDGFLKQKPFILLSSHSLPHAKSTGYFLVLVPLIAFCITCILGAFHTRVPSDMGRRAVDKSRKKGHNSMRWKNALSDIKEQDNLDSESSTDLKNTSEDQDKNLNEDMSHAYRLLEQDYQKFLSECGMSKSGYWRGDFHK